MKKWLLRIAGCMIIFLYIWVVVLGNDILQPSIATKVLRFHVLANSDSNADQSVKKEVRDAVGTYLQPFLEDAASLSETKEIVEEHIDNILAISKETLEEHGYDYPVSAKITKTDFPEKTYGNYTFPKGKYEALQIIIGEGNGQNWWCVLYPNMCFSGSVFEIVEEEAKASLKEVLNAWEYADVFDSGNVQMRFKFLEYFTE